MISAQSIKWAFKLDICLNAITLTAGLLKTAITYFRSEYQVLNYQRIYAFKTPAFIGINLCQKTFSGLRLEYQGLISAILVFRPEYQPQPVVVLEHLKN